MAQKLKGHYEKASRPSVGLTSTEAGVEAGFAIEDRRRLSRILLSGVSRLEFAAVALVEFSRVNRSTAAAFLKVTPARLADLLNSLHSRHRAIETQQQADSQRERCDSELKAIKPTRIKCAACDFLNLWLPGNGALCQACLEPLNHKLLRGRATDPEVLKAAKAHRKHLSTR